VSNDPAKRGILRQMSDSASVEQRVIDAIARSKRVDAAKIRPQTTFEELGMDSLDAIELLFEIEEEFDLTVEDEAVQGKENVGQVIAAVQEALAETAAGGDGSAGEE
jgi:acyl carrier protein